MSRKANDGRGRLGGRSKGTQNKTPVSVTEWIGSLIGRRRKQYEKDLDSLTPFERAKILTDLICRTAPVEDPTIAKEESL